MMMKNKMLTVWSHDEQTPHLVMLGKLNTDTLVFDYSETWNDTQSSQRFNPIGALPKTPLASSLIMDSMPDSWGRSLIERLLMARARRDEVAFIGTTDCIVLRHVADVTRMGAYRFSLDDSTNHFVGESENPLPKAEDLTALKDLSLRFERKELLSAQTLAPLVEFGASLSGSRPKVNFVNTDGALWIAKLPSIHDNRNYGAWEYVSMQMAKECGIRVPEFDLVNGDTFVTKRFDRTEDGARRHYFSTRALLGAQENREPRSYLEILGLIERICGNDSQDIEDLFTRVVFKIMVSDGDDHLRNHGFLLTDSGWHLAPAFDLTPSLSTSHLCLTWDDKCSCFNLAGLISAAPVWGIGVERAREIVTRCSQVVQTWREKALAAGISQDEINLMKDAFEKAAF